MVYPFQTHLINCFVFIDCENGDIANTEKISNFLTKNKSKYFLSDGNADDLIKKLESDGVIEIKNNKITWKK